MPAKTGSSSSVDLNTKIVFIKANVHFLIIPCLYTLLILTIVAGTAYNYQNMPETITVQGQKIPLPPDALSKLRQELVLEGFGIFTLVPFYVLAVLSAIITWYNNKYWYGFCALFTLGIAVAFSGYCATVLAYLRLKYVWPPLLVPELLATTAQPQPFSTQEFMENFVEKLLLVITLCMFGAILVQGYCAFVLISVSFLYKSPKPDLHAVKVIPKKRKEEPKEPKEEEDEDGEGGTDGDQTGTKTDGDKDDKDKGQSVIKSKMGKETETTENTKESTMSEVKKSSTMKV